MKSSDLHSIWVTKILHRNINSFAPLMFFPRGEGGEGGKDFLELFSGTDFLEHIFLELFSGTNFWWPNRSQNEADRAETSENHNFSALRGKKRTQNRFIPENLVPEKFSSRKFSSRKIFWNLFPPYRSEIGSGKNNNGWWICILYRYLED